jgi:hypothetical protein
VASTAYGYVRNREVGRALSAGEDVPSSDQAALVFAAFGVILGIFTAVLLVATG